MKKLYRKNTVHPTLQVDSDQLLLSFLPPAILTLAAALLPEEREVLAYLISCASVSFCSNYQEATPKTAACGGANVGMVDHPPCFSCYCFRCYTSYWVKWDSSPSRQLIHEIIDAFEDSILKQSRKEKGKRRKGKIGHGNSLGSDEMKNSELNLSMDVFSQIYSAAGEPDSGGDEEGGAVEKESDKGPVRRFVSFIGERIWSVWA